MKQLVIMRSFFLILLVTCSLLLFYEVVQAQTLIKCSTDDYELYSYKDYELSGQKYIHSRQDIVQFHSPLADAAKKVFGPIVTEPNYCYIVFNLIITNRDVLFIPRGEGHFSLTILTADGSFVVQDCGVFVQVAKNNQILTATTLDGPVFVDPNHVMLNRIDEPRVIIRFPKETKLDQIVSMTGSRKIKTINWR